MKSLEGKIVIREIPLFDNSTVTPALELPASLDRKIA